MNLATRMLSTVLSAGCRVFARPSLPTIRGERVNDYYKLLCLSFCIFKGVGHFNPLPRTSSPFNRAGHVPYSTRGPGSLLYVVTSLPYNTFFL